MKPITILAFFATISLFAAVKPLPPGSGVSVRPNVLFIIDTSGSMGGWGNPSAMTQTKNALTALLSDSNITQSIRMGLSEFPRSTRKQITVPVRDNSETHLSDLQSGVNALYASGGTPLKEASESGGWYYKNLGATNNVCYGSIDCSSPIEHWCQKNYLVLFTDGVANSGPGPVSTTVQSLRTNYLSGFQVDGREVYYKNILTYAIGFGGTNVQYIATAGGTGTSYNASNTQQLLDVFRSIIADIGAKNITSAVPTLIPSFAGPDNDVIYQSQFLPREGKQWEGHFYKYVLNDDGWVTTATWDSGRSDVIALANNRNIFTRCKGGTSGQVATKFVASDPEGEILADCLMMEGGGGAATPIEVCNTTTYDWEEWVSDYWQPEREPSTYSCRNNFYNQIFSSYDSYKHFCSMYQFSTYSGGNCNGNATTDARLIERYLCQYNHTCDCYSDWTKNSGATRTCSADSTCRSSHPSQPNALCINGYCTGGQIYGPGTADYDSTMWLENPSANYRNNLNRVSKTVGNPSTDYDTIELDLRDLLLSTNGNSNTNRTFLDYIEIQGITTGLATYYYYIVDGGKIFDCGTGGAQDSGNSKRLSTCTLVTTMTNGVVTIPRGQAKIYFYSNASHNDIAFKLMQYRLKKAPVTVCHWEPGGPGTGHTTDALKEARKLIHFFRGKDSYKDDNDYSNDDACTGKTAGSDCPERSFRIADIYNSRAKYFGKPNQTFTYSTYRDFINNNTRSGNEVLIVGSNDGMIHAFKISDGKEAWAFVPPNLLSYLKNIIVSPSETKSQFFVDRSPKIMDIFDHASSTWKSVLLIGFGEGGAGLMALDITNVSLTDGPTFLWAIYNESPWILDSPLFDNWNNRNTLKRVLYWGSDGGVTVYSKNIRDNAPTGIDTDLLDKLAGTEMSNNHQFDYSNLYYTWSEPIIAQINSSSDTPGTFVGIMGGGGLQEAKPASGTPEYGSSIYMFNVLNGSLIKTFNITNSNSNVSARVPATVAVLPEPQLEENREAKLIYVADLAGHVWRINPKKGDTATTQTHTCSSSSTDSANGCIMLFNSNADNTKKDYVYYSIALAYDGNPNSADTSVWVYYGTGNSDIYDLTENAGTNTLYAIKDSTWDTFDPTSTKTPSNLTLISSTYNSGSTCDPQTNGWRYNLAGKEKLVGDPTIIEGYSYFTVYEHGEDSGGECSGHLGLSYIYSFELFSGCFNPDFKLASANPGPKGLLGKGVATSPVMKGDVMYFGISGETDSENDSGRFDDMERKDNLIRWERKSASTTETSDVPFTYFKEIF
ncbi:VWA domain-containing protein [bacterium]|nr:VWA domain-containing protein [bacterium]